MPYTGKISKVTSLNQFPEVFHASIHLQKWVRNELDSEEICTNPNNPNAFRNGGAKRMEWNNEGFPTFPVVD